MLANGQPSLTGASGAVPVRDLLVAAAPEAKGIISMERTISLLQPRSSPPLPKTDDEALGSPAVHPAARRIYLWRRVAIYSRKASSGFHYYVRSYWP